MLKWTVKRTSETPAIDTYTRRFSEIRNTDLGSPNNGNNIENMSNKTGAKNVKKLHRRHSHGATVKRRSSCSKENKFQFMSTPKSKEYPTGSYIRFDTIALRDVSNITPTNYTPSNNLENNINLSNKRRRSQPLQVNVQKPCENCRKNNKYESNINNDVNLHKKRKLDIKDETINKIQTNNNLVLPNENEEIKNTISTIPTIEKPVKFAPTLPTFEIEYSPGAPLYTEHIFGKCCCTKSNTNCCQHQVNKTDHINAFLSQISSVTSPEDIDMQFTDINHQAKQSLNIFPTIIKKTLLPRLQKDNFISVSPLTTKLSGLQFSHKKCKKRDEKNASSNSDEFDNLSLDQMVNEILETTEQVNNSRLKVEKIEEQNNVNIEKCVEFNEREVKTPENVSLNLERKRSISPVNNTSFNLKRQKCVRRKKVESTTKLNGLTLANGIPSPSSELRNINRNNSITKSSRNNLLVIEQDLFSRQSPLMMYEDDTVSQVSTPQINVEELLGMNLTQTPLTTFPGYKKFGARQLLGLTLPGGIPSPNINTPQLLGKRLSETYIVDPERSPIADLINLEENQEMPTTHTEIENKMDEYETPYSTPWRTSDENIMKLLKNSRSELNNRESISEKRKSKNKFSSIDLNIGYRNRKLLVHVIGCKQLTRPNNKSINAYVKVSLLSNGDKEGSSKEKSCGGLHRTTVHKNSSHPRFDQMFSFDVSTKSDLNKKLQLTVWHRDREYKRSEFLGCVTFSVKHIIKKEIVGVFKLNSQSSSDISASSHNTKSYIDSIEGPYTESTDEDFLIYSGCERINNENMGDQSLSSIEEIIELDKMQDIVSIDLSKATTKKKLNEQQKVADENLFLRYLELDPTEGPDAIPAAMQRKASGNKMGRTPFTTTKRLTRTPESGFGFSVVWTHPPRVERVEKGLPAEKAGLLPGDYIIFVDKHNVVMMPEIDILNLIRSYGTQLTIEVFRRNNNINEISSNQNGVVSNSRSASVTIVTPPVSVMAPSAVAACSSSKNLLQQQQARSSTACSVNTTSDYNRKKLHLPQVTFSAENRFNGTQPPEDNRRRTLQQLVLREQHYATAMQFAVGRFVAPLFERHDLLASSDHKILFQNASDLLQISDDILDSIVGDDGEVHLSLIPKIYHEKLSLITSSYKKYCTGLQRADCVLANKTRNTNSEFVRFLHNPAIPRRRPDITGFIHKPLEHYREILKLLQTVLLNTKSNHEDYQIISKVVQELQITYREITSTAGLMEPVGEGRPLLSIQDLESRLVFTRCKPFVLNIPGRQWIFGGDLSRIEGRNSRPFWTLLFSDILLFAKVSRDRVLFITEEPLPLINITDVFFNIRKKATEFRVNVSVDGGKMAESPTAHCGPDLSKTPRKNSKRRCIVLRTPTTELKAVWQNLLTKQIHLVHSGVTTGTPFSSPMESPDPPMTSSVATLQSADSYSFRRQSIPQKDTTNQELSQPKQIQKLIDHKCRQLGKTGLNKGSAIHLAQWFKGQLDSNTEYEVAGTASVTSEEAEPEVWTKEELQKRSRELCLIDSNGLPKTRDQVESHCESILLSDVDASPSKSTTSGSQITVRSSPVIQEKVPVCRQCHKNCMSLANGPNTNANYTNNNVVCNSEKCQQINQLNESNNNTTDQNEFEDDTQDWGSFMLMGLSAIRPATSLVKMDPFAPCDIPKISVLPPTPDLVPRNAQEPSQILLKTTSITNDSITPPNKSPRRKLELQKSINANDDTPEESPQNEEPPYLVMVPKNPGLKRYGTWSSLGRIPSDELVEAPDSIEDQESSTEDDEEEEDEDDDDDNEDIKGGPAITQSIMGWTARAGSFVAEKMALFEKLGEDSRAALDRYLRPTEQDKIDQELEVADEEFENSGATSGEEIWGTPTSGGEVDEMLNFPNSHAESLSDSNGSAYGDEDDLIMDELLMAPPMTGAVVRGLLPRRRLEPLLEEDDTDSCTTTSIANNNEPSPSPEQGSECGDVADILCAASAVDNQTENQQEIESSSNIQQIKTPPPPPPRRFLRNQTTKTTITKTINGGVSSTKTSTKTTDTVQEVVHTLSARPSRTKTRSSSKTKSKYLSNGQRKEASENQVTHNLRRAASYKHIIEEEENALTSDPNSPSHLKNLNDARARMRQMYLKTTSIVTNSDIEHNIIVNPTSYRSRSTRLIEFLSGRRQEDFIGISGPSQNTNLPRNNILKLFSKDSTHCQLNVSTTFSQRSFSPRRETDKQLDRRFWKQLRRRRRNNLTTEIEAI